MPAKVRANPYIMGALVLYALGLSISGFVTGAPTFYVISMIALGIHGSTSGGSCF